VTKNGQKFEDLHEGKRAQKELKKQNPEATKQEQNIAFSEAMRATQDDFSDRVGQRFGLARLGPGRRRLTRSQWKAEQTQAEALQKTLAKHNSYKKHYKKEAIAEAQISIEQAKEQAKAEGLAEAQKAGAKLGGLWSGVKDKLSGPTEREQQAIKQAQQAQAKAEEEARSAKAKADNRVTKVAEQLQAEQAKNKSLEKELEKAEQKLQDLTPAHQNSNRKGHGLN
jgi:Rps23 Pro-64 3,4-dihydroxylase Tpa1-like proline 4-hydroxylase